TTIAERLSALPPTETVAVPVAVDEPAVSRAPHADAAAPLTFDQAIPGSRGSGHVRGFLRRQGSGLCRHGDIRYDATSTKTCRRGGAWRLRFSRSVPWPICLWCWG